MPVDPISLTTFLGLVGGALGTALSYDSQQKTNKKNENINTTNLDYNAALTRESWERDDTAHQREVADLEAAGLSPLANTTGSQVTSPLSAPNPIAMQAPQIDTNSIMNAMLRSSELQEEKRHNLEIENAREIELTQQATDLVIKAEQLNLDNKKVEETIRYQTELNKNMAETLAETKEHNDEEEYLRRVEYESSIYFKEINEQVPEGCRYYDIYDLEIYSAHMKLWNTKFKNFMNEIGATQKASAKSQTNSANGGFNVGVTSVPGAPGATGGANGGYTNSTSEYEMENLDRKQKLMLEAFYRDNPIPVYHVKKWELKKGA